MVHLNAPQFAYDELHVFPADLLPVRSEKNLFLLSALTIFFHFFFYVCHITLCSVWAPKEI